MTTEKIKQLCAKILIPIISDILRAELRELNEMVEAIGGALVRLEKGLAHSGLTDSEQ